MRKLKILYVGPDYEGSNGTCWRNAFQRLGHEVLTVDDERMIPQPSTLVGRIAKKLDKRPPQWAIDQLNGHLRKAITDFKPDFTFYIKAYYVEPQTLDLSRQYGPNFAYMNDDMFNPWCQTHLFFENIRRLDVVFTTKSYNVREFHRHGTPLAVYIPNSYDPEIHFPAQPNADERRRMEGDVAFIGTFRVPRADFLARLAHLRNELKFNVWGTGWSKLSRFDHWHRWFAWKDLRTCIRGKELWCADMGKAIQANSISLGLLCHENRDLHTSRTFEIPACGGFMLAERSEEHRLYFAEDKEAVYFQSFEELLDKIRFYIGHPESRQRIAQAGYERCTRSKATYVDRAQFAIEQFGMLRPAQFSGTGVPSF